MLGVGTAWWPHGLLHTGCLERARPRTGRRVRSEGKSLSCDGLLKGRALRRSAAHQQRVGEIESQRLARVVMPDSALGIRRGDLARECLECTVWRYDSIPTTPRRPPCSVVHEWQSVSQVLGRV